jgi:hypothetical protein
MLRFTSSALLLLLLGGGVAAAPNTVEVNADGSTSTPTTDEKPPIVECGVYMAPSTLGEKTNMGIYTGKLLQPNEVINYPEIAIPLLFREWGTHKPGFIGKKSHCFESWWCWRLTLPLSLLFIQMETFGSDTFGKAPL